MATKQVIFRPDSRGELDEVFVEAKHVHVERMDKRCFWIGVQAKDGTMVMIYTGIGSRGEWFFNVQVDEVGGETQSIEKPACYAKHARAK